MNKTLYRLSPETSSWARKIFLSTTLQKIYFHSSQILMRLPLISFDSRNVKRIKNIRIRYTNQLTRRQADCSNSKLNKLFNFLRQKEKHAEGIIKVYYI